MKILVVSHGSFSKSLVETAEMISGKNENIDYLGLYPGDNSDELSNTIKIKLEKDPRIKIILVDLLGGSPMIASVKAVKSLNRDDISLYSGVNLALLLEISQATNVADGESINTSELLSIAKDSVSLVLEGK